MGRRGHSAVGRVRGNARRLEAGTGLPLAFLGAMGWGPKALALHLFVLGLVQVLCGAEEIVSSGESK